MLREDMVPFDIAYRLPSGQYGVTPDAVGIYWYDTYAEVVEQHGELPVRNVKDIL